MSSPIASWTVVAALASVAHGASAQARTAACCTVTTIDATTGVVAAKVTASGHVFEFKARTPSTLAAL